MSSKPTYTDEEVMSVIRQTVTELGYIPTFDEFRQIHRYKYATTICRRLGGWRAVLATMYTPHQLAKLRRFNWYTAHKHNDEQMLQALRDWAAKHGRIPIASDFGTDGLRSTGAYRRHFKSLNGARLAAGLKAIIASGGRNNIYYELTADELKLWRRGDYESGVVPRRVVEYRRGHARQRLNKERKEQHGL